MNAAPSDSNSFVPDACRAREAATPAPMVGPSFPSRTRRSRPSSGKWHDADDDDVEAASAPPPLLGPPTPSGMRSSGMLGDSCTSAPHRVMAASPPPPTVTMSTSPPGNHSSELACTGDATPGAPLAVGGARGGMPTATASLSATPNLVSVSGHSSTMVEAASGGEAPGTRGETQCVSCAMPSLPLRINIAAESLMFTSTTRQPWKLVHYGEPDSKERDPCGTSLVGAPARKGDVFTARATKAPLPSTAANKLSTVAPTTSGMATDDMMARVSGSAEHLGAMGGVHNDACDVVTDHRKGNSATGRDGKLETKAAVLERRSAT